MCVCVSLSFFLFVVVDFFFLKKKKKEKKEKKERKNWNKKDGYLDFNGYGDQKHVGKGMYMGMFNCTPKSPNSFLIIVLFAPIMFPLYIFSSFYPKFMASSGPYIYIYIYIYN